MLLPGFGQLPDFRSAAPRCRVMFQPISGYFSADRYSIRFGRYFALLGCELPGRQQNRSFTVAAL